MSEDDLSQVDGIYCLAASVKPRSKNDFVAREFQTISRLAKHVFPVRTKTHLLCIPHKKKPSLATEILNAQKGLFLQYFQSLMGVKVHVQSEPDQIRDELLALGLIMKGIPTLYGGDWKFEDFSDWCEERMNRENEQYKGRLLEDKPLMSWKRITCSNIGNPGVSVAAVSASVVDDTKSCQVEKDAQDEAQENERLAKKRMVSLLYSRRKRERQRIGWELLQSESSGLMAENERLLSEQTRLEGLVADAENCVNELAHQPFP